MQYDFGILYEKKTFIPNFLKVMYVKKSTNFRHVIKSVKMNKSNIYFKCININYLLPIDFFSTH